MPRNESWPPRAPGLVLHSRPACQPHAHMNTNDLSTQGQSGVWITRISIPQYFSQGATGGYRHFRMRPSTLRNRVDHSQSGRLQGFIWLSYSTEHLEVAVSRGKLRGVEC